MNTTTMNGEANTPNGHNERDWVKKFLDRICSSQAKSKTTYILTEVLRGLGCFFSLIGVIATVRWVFSTNTSDTNSLKVPSCGQSECSDISKYCTGPNYENCPWNHVFNDLTNRLHLLEMAFKDQVVARETMEREVNNQSDVNVILNVKLAEFTARLDNISNSYDHLEVRISQLASKLKMDEILIFMLVILILVEIAFRVRPFVQNYINIMKNKRKSSSSSYKKKVNGNEKNEKIKLSSGPSTPKHFTLKNEMCVVLFRRENNNIYASLMENMLKHFHDIKLASSPFFIVDNINDIKTVPPVKLYVVICDCEVSSAKTNGWDEYITVIKVLRSITANVIVIIANEEGSKKLVAHSLYNSNLRLVNTYDCIRDIASSGRFYSMWQDMTSHQMGHLRKILRNVLNVRPSMTPSR